MYTVVTKWGISRLLSSHIGKLETKYVGNNYCPHIPCALRVNQAHTRTSFYLFIFRCVRSMLITVKDNLLDAQMNLQLVDRIIFK